MTQKLTQKMVSAAIARGQECELRDTQTRGLVLRVRLSGRWAWTYRRAVQKKEYRREFGQDWTLEEARGLAEDLNVEARKRFPDALVNEFAFADWIGRKRAAKAGVRYFPPPPPPPEPEPAGFLWRDAMTPWAEELYRTLRETTASDYVRAVRVAELRKFHDRRVDSIGLEEVAEAIAAIAKRGKERQAQTSTIAVRNFFSWMGGIAQRTKYRVKPGAMRDLEAPPITLCEEGEDERKVLFVPQGADVARIVRWLRADNAPERDRLAGLLLVYSVQRERYVAKARRSEFQVVDGHCVWSMPPLHRKTASKRKRRGQSVGQHVIPLPPAAWAVVQRAIEIGSDSEWLFPAKRDRRKGNPATTMSPSNLPHLFGDIPGNPATPHDIRRAFGTTYGKFAKLPLSDIKKVLDHSEGVPSGDVTAEHYAFLENVRDKWPMMRGWVDWVDAVSA